MCFGSFFEHDHIGKASVWERESGNYIFFLSLPFCLVCQLQVKNILVKRLLVKKLTNIQFLQINFVVKNQPELVMELWGLGASVLFAFLFHFVNSQEVGPNNNNNNSMLFT